MIDWGQIPAGSKASIYWPQVQAVDVLALSQQLYSTDQLFVADANTVQCTVPKNGITWIPIPPGSGARFAGLFTIDLPPGSVTVGEVFNVIVRRISSRNLEYPARTPTTESMETGAVAGKTAVMQKGAVAEATAPVKTMRNWRYVVGTFAVRIPVTTAKTILPLEENTLAIMKWRLNQMSPTNRWYPVLERYILYISDRINGLGGNASSIEPSPYGTPALPPHKEELCELTGKVVGLIYDRFGDFEGFYLLTEEGHEKMFRSREREIEQLVRTAWLDRMVITVFVMHHEMHYPVSIVLRRAPRL
jgi:hypothetical protein